MNRPARGSIHPTALLWVTSAKCSSTLCVLCLNLLHGLCSVPSIPSHAVPVPSRELQSEVPSMPEEDMDSLLVKGCKPPRPSTNNVSLLSSNHYGHSPEGDYSLIEGELHITCSCMQLAVRLWVLASHMLSPATLVKCQEHALVHTSMVIQVALGQWYV